MKSKIKAVPIVLFLSVLVLHVSCQKQKAKWKGTIEEDKDGYQYIKRCKVTWKY